MRWRTVRDVTEQIRIGQPPSAPIPPAKPGRPRWPLLAGGAALLVAVTATATAWLTGGDGAVPASSPSAYVATTFSITGEMTLPRGDFTWSQGLDTCSGRGGYDDMTRGTTVVVTDETGKTIALGELQTGVADRDPDATDFAIRCRLKFDVTGIPEGHQFYSVEVGHRGEVQYTRDGLNRPLSLELH